MSPHRKTGEFEHVFTSYPYHLLKLMTCPSSGQGLRLNIFGFCAEICLGFSDDFNLCSFFVHPETKKNLRKWQLLWLCSKAANNLPLASRLHGSIHSSYMAILWFIHLRVTICYHSYGTMLLWLVTVTICYYMNMLQYMLENPLFSLCTPAARAQIGPRTFSNPSSCGTSMP